MNVVKISPNNPEMSGLIKPESNCVESAFNLTSSQSNRCNFSTVHNIPNDESSVDIEFVSVKHELDDCPEPNYNDSPIEAIKFEYNEVSDDNQNCQSSQYSSICDIAQNESYEVPELVKHELEHEMTVSASLKNELRDPLELDDKQGVLNSIKSQYNEIKCNSMNDVACDGSIDITENDLKADVGTHGMRRPFKCTHCSITFTRLTDFKTHERAHTDKRPHKWHLKSRERIRSRKRPFKCMYCSKSFSQLSTLNNHKRTHTGERPYECTHCPKTFTQLTSLNRHKRIHTGERPYECTHCSKSFSDSSGLRSHKQLHGDERPFKCTHCSKTFARSPHLKVHTRMHKRKQGIGAYEET